LLIADRIAISVLTREAQSASFGSSGTARARPGHGDAEAEFAHVTADHRSRRGPESMYGRPVMIIARLVLGLVAPRLLDLLGVRQARGPGAHQPTAP